jgi:hypothetical protein
MRARLTGAAPHLLQQLPVGNDNVRMPHQAFEDPMLQRRQLDVLTCRAVGHAIAEIDHDVAEPDDRVPAATAPEITQAPSCCMMVQ